MKENKKTSILIALVIILTLAIILVTVLYITKREKNKTYAADDKVKGSDFYLFYAINEKTGEKALYVYDKLEGTIQRFNSDLVNAYKDESNKYFMYMLISLGLLAVSIITLAIVLIKQKKHKTKFA